MEIKVCNFLNKVFQRRCLSQTLFGRGFDGFLIEKLTQLYCFVVLIKSFRLLLTLLLNCLLKAAFGMVEPDANWWVEL